MLRLQHYRRSIRTIRETKHQYQISLSQHEKDTTTMLLELKPHKFRLKTFWLCLENKNSENNYPHVIR